MGNTAFNKIGIGLAAGLVATVPMTLAMVWAWKRLPREEQYALPPQEIVTILADKADLPVPLTPNQHLAATSLSHFGFGAMAGALYALKEEEVNAPPACKGMAYGLLVWMTWYLALWPLFRVLKPAIRHPVRRSALMIGAHLVWGAALSPLVAGWKAEP